jgi:hypothetical protein
MKHPHKFYVPLKITRKQKFKDLMRNRKTEDQGLTFKQIFCEVYSDLIELQISKEPKFDVNMIDNYGLQDRFEWQVPYLKRVIKQTKRTDLDFRWLSVLPVKRNEVYPRTGKKVRPYLEYRYININASETPELLEHVNAIWSRRNKAVLEGLYRLKKRLEYLDEYLATPEGQAAEERERKKVLAENRWIQEQGNQQQRIANEEGKKEGEGEKEGIV